MATELTLTHQNGLHKAAYLGWSWTSFFFGGIPAIFRGDWMAFFIWLFVAILLAALTAGIGNLVLLFAWAALYNKWHTRRLVERGYQVTGAAIPLDAAKARVFG